MGRRRAAARSARHPVLAARHSAPAACREAARRVLTAVAHLWETAKAGSSRRAAVAKSYPHRQAAAQPVLTAAVRPWETAKALAGLWQPAAVPEAALRRPGAVGAYRRLPAVARSVLMAAVRP
jgi:hypothetical protein